MNVLVFKSTDVGGLYGEKYNEIFDKIWEDHLNTLPEVEKVVYLPSSMRGQMEEYLVDMDAVLGVWITDGLINEEFLSRHPKLKYIATLAHGFGKIDMEAVHRHGVTITNTIYGDVTIAQFAMGLLLDICHNVTIHSDYYKKDKWNGKEEGKMILHPQIELYEKTIGIVGLGNIGYMVAKMAQGFGMNVISYSRTKKEDSKYDFIEQVSFDELLERSDVISINCPHNPQTKNLINKETIEKMKDGVIFINTARGEIVDEEALYDGLQSGKIYAAGLDVVVGEPISEPCKLMECENTKITEHIAWLPVESRMRSVRLCCENFHNWATGHPTSVVSE